MLMESSKKDRTLLRDPIEVRLGIANAGGEFSTLAIVAHKQGYFADEGLDVILTKEESGVSAFKGLKDGTTDVITASDFAFVNNSIVDTSVKIIATIDSADAVEVIVRNDAEISSPNDLIGKRIGVVPQTAAHFVLLRFLTMNDLTVNDLTVVELSYKEAEEAITSGAVDAVIINNPYAYNIARALGPNGGSWQAQYNQPLLFNAISNDAFIDSNPEAVEGFLRALIRAEKFVQINSDQAKEDVRESFSFTQDYIDQLWDNHVFTVRLDQVLLPILETQARWVLLNKTNENTAIPNYLQRVYVDGLRAIAPEAVTIIK